MKDSIVRSKSEWQTILRKFNNKHDVYHNYEYLKLYENSECDVVGYFFSDSEDFFFLPYLKKKIEGSSYFDFESAYGYGGPLTTSIDKDFLSRCWKKFKDKIYKEKIIAGIIRFNPILNSKKYLENIHIKKIYECKSVVLNCHEPLENVRDNYSNDIKQRLKKVDKNLISISFNNKMDDLLKFYRIYNQRMHDLKADKDYFFSENYFKRFENLNVENWKIMILRYKDKIIGGALILFSKHICSIHLSSSVKQYFNLSPNIIIRDALIEFCFKKKIEFIHFGGGRTDKEDDTLLKFKEKFCKTHKLYFLGGIISNDKVYNELINKNSFTNKYKNYFLKYRY